MIHFGNENATAFEDALRVLAARWCRREEVRELEVAGPVLERNPDPPPDVAEVERILVWRGALDAQELRRPR